MSKYNFYDLIELEFDIGNRQSYQRYFDNEYARIADSHVVKSSKTSTINLSVVKHLPESQPGDLIRRIRFKKLFNYTFMVRSLESKDVKIFFQAHPIDKVYMNAVGVFLQAHVIEPIMYFKLLESKIIFLHAAGVEKAGRGYLLPAQGGTGKTTFSMALLSHGFKLLGDDLLLVDTGKQIVYPYPRPLHLFTYNINSLRGARVPLKFKLVIYAKNVLRFFLEKILRIEFLISTRVHADQIFSGQLFGKAAKYKDIYFLRKSGPQVEKHKITADNVERFSSEIIQSADLNKSLYKIVKPGEISKIKKLEINSLNNLLLRLGSITYINTRLLDLNDLNRFIAEIFDA